MWSHHKTWRTQKSASELMGKLCVLLVEISVVTSVVHVHSSLLEDVETKLGHSFATWLWFSIF